MAPTNIPQLVNVHKPLYNYGNFSLIARRISETMIKNSFLNKLNAKWEESKFICVGLDNGDFDFNKTIIDQTSDLVCAYKPNPAFYEAEGLKGWKALEETISYIKQKCPDVVIILDAKRADINNTNRAYAKSAFDTLGVDAVTVNPYPGKAALQPFLDYKDKGIIVWLASSNPGEDKFQDLIIADTNQPLYQFIAQQIAESWNTNGNLAVVVGATYPEELVAVRKIVGDMPILVPGIGTQGGDLEVTIKNGLNSKKQGLIISSSRGIIFSDNPREATLKLHQDIVSSLREVR